MPVPYHEIDKLLCMPKDNRSFERQPNQEGIKEAYDQQKKLMREIEALLKEAGVSRLEKKKVIKNMREKHQNQWLKFAQDYTFNLRKALQEQKKMQDEDNNRGGKAA